MSIESILDWQRRFRAGLSVWITFYKEDGGIEELSSVYETKEGASAEVAFAKRQGRRLPVIREHHIHTDQLAIERWCSDDIPQQKGAQPTNPIRDSANAPPASREGGRR